MLPGRPLISSPPSAAAIEMEEPAELGRKDNVSEAVEGSEGSIGSGCEVEVRRRDGENRREKMEKDTRGLVLSIRSIDIW